MNEIRSREEILDSLQQNARALGDDIGILGQSLQDTMSPKSLILRNPMVKAAVGAGAVVLAIMVITGGRNRIFRMVAGGVASAVGSVLAAQAARWVKTRVEEHLQPEEQEA